MQKLLNHLRLSIFISLISLVFSSTASAQTIVCLDTTLGDVCMELMDTEAPVTAQNFLSYVQNDNYQNSFFHELTSSSDETTVSAGDYVLTSQTGFEGFQTINKSPAIINESSVSNTRGTVAMVPDDADDPDSVTTRFQININDNPALDSRNGGYTVFANIIGDGMAIVDAMATLQTISLENGEVPRIPVLEQKVPVVNSAGITIFNASVFDGDLEDFENNGSGDGTGDTEDETPTPETGETLYEDAVCVDTNVGEYCMELFPQRAPATVASFLRYLNDGDYDDTLIHRTDPEFIIQGGGYYSDPLGADVPKDPAIINEFNQSNLRGTVAMAKLGGQVNSATSEWFVNLSDNTFLDGSDGSGGGFFTVFARVITGMDVVDSIGNLPRLNLSASLGGAFGEVPRSREVSAGGVVAEDLVLVNRVYVTDVIAADDGSGGDGDGDGDDGVVTTAEYSTLSGAFFLPVRIGDALYRVIMRRDTTVSGLVFAVDTTRIVAIADIGQETATMDLDAGTLVIPSIKVGDRVFVNLMFDLTEFSTLTFTLVDYDKG